MYNKLTFGSKKKWEKTMRIDNIHQALKQFHVQNPSSKETFVARNGFAIKSGLWLYPNRC